MAETVVENVNVLLLSMYVGVVATNVQVVLPTITNVELLDDVESEATVEEDLEVVKASKAMQDLNAST